MIMTFFCTRFIPRRPIERSAHSSIVNKIYISLRPEIVVIVIF